MTPAQIEAAVKLAHARDVVGGPSHDEAFWLVAPTTPEIAALHADVKLHAEPERATASEWRTVRRMAGLTDKGIKQGDAQGAAWAAIRMMQAAMRAELREGPIPQLIAAKQSEAELRDRPARAGRQARGKPKPNRKTPLRKALEILVAEGMNNDQVFGELSDVDRISSRARNDAFPIEVDEPKTTVLGDGYLAFYLPGESSEKARRKNLKQLRQLLSDIRKVRVSRLG